jgi:hypothetical protein
LDVIPNWERREVRQSASDSVVLPLHKYRSAVGIDFDGADAPVSAEQSAQYAAANACKAFENV